MSRLNHGGIEDIEEKAISETDDVITITGYASTFGNVDRGNDIVMPGAFAESLKTHGLPLMLWQHKMDDPPIGTVVEAKEDAKGLWYKAELPKDDALIRDRIGKQLKRRAIKSNSIGYSISRSERRKSDGVRLLKSVKLWEISLVNLPMNPLASVDSVKGFVPFQDLPIGRDAKAWDAAAALARVTQKLGDEAKHAFLLASDALDPRLMIADLDERGELVVNPVACFKAAAALASGGFDLDDDALEAIGAHLDRYYGRLNLESPSKSFSAEEFDALTEREREARLKGIGVSNSLAKRIASGQWDADRKSRRDDAATEAKAAILSALAATLGDAAKSISKRN